AVARRWAVLCGGVCCAVGDLEDTEAEDRHLDAVVEGHVIHGISFVRVIAWFRMGSWRGPWVCHGEGRDGSLCRSRRDAAMRMRRRTAVVPRPRRSPSMKLCPARR